MAERRQSRWLNFDEKRMLRSLIFIFFSFLYIISKTNDRIKKIYWQKMSILTSSIKRSFFNFSV